MDSRSSDREPDAASPPSVAHSLVEQNRNSWIASLYDQTKVVNLSKDVNIENQNTDM
jgi:hypothetical protein